MKKISKEFIFRRLGAPILAVSMVAAASQMSAFTLQPSIDTAPYFPQGIVPAITGKQTLYVAAQTATGRSHLLVINTQFNTITADVTLINLITLTPEIGATQVALNPAGTLAFVVNFTTNTVDVVDTATNTEFFTFRAPQIGPNPVGVRVSPNGSQLWVANSANNPPFLNNGTVSVINLSNFASIAQINSGGSPNTVVFSTTGSAAFVLNGNLNGFVDLVNVAKFTIPDNDIGRPNLNNPDFLAMDITNDNSTLYIGNFESYVNNVDVLTDSVDNNIFMFPGIGVGLQDIGQVLVSPDQRFVVCADVEISRVSVAKTKTQAFLKFLSTSGGSQPYFMAFSQDSTTLYISEAFFTGGNMDIAVWAGF
jgi:DNA-binding beta-propeller fold protein YncE